MYLTIFFFLLHSLFSQIAFDSRSPSWWGFPPPPRGDFKFMHKLIYRVKFSEKCKLN